MDRKNLSDCGAVVCCVWRQTNKLMERKQAVNPQCGGWCIHEVYSYITAVELVWNKHFSSSFFLFKFLSFEAVDVLFCVTRFIEVTPNAELALVERNTKIKYRFAFSTTSILSYNCIYWRGHSFQIVCVPFPLQRHISAVLLKCTKIQFP